MSNDFILKQRYAPQIRWSSRGTCGQSGCTDPECGCALCGLPIGVAEEDPRRIDHDSECFGCSLCEDDVPMILFRGKGQGTQQAQFHNKCFSKIIHIRPGIKQ